MRKTVLAMGLYVCFICGLNLSAQEYILEKNVVVVTAPVDDAGHISETIEPAPFETIYIEEMSSLMINSFSNIGNILVSIINDSGTFYYSGVVSTYPNSAIIPLSGYPGHYTINYTILSTGAEYISTFQL